MDKKNLNPQAAQYYKRLILVSDRYMALLKKHNAYRAYNWILLTIVTVETLVLIKGIPEAVNFVNSLINGLVW